MGHITWPVNPPVALVTDGAVFLSVFQGEQVHWSPVVSMGQYVSFEVTVLASLETSFLVAIRSLCKANPIPNASIRTATPQWPIQRPAVQSSCVLMGELHWKNLILPQCAVCPGVGGCALKGIFNVFSSGPPDPKTIFLYVVCGSWQFVGVHCIRVEIWI